MLRALWAKLFGSPSPAPAPSPRPQLAGDAEVAGRPVPPTGLGDVPAEQLMELCDRFWERLAAPSPPDWPVNERYMREFSDQRARYINAINELSHRGAEVLPWARKRLSHPEYVARELAALLIGEIGQCGELGDQRAAVIEELSALAVRPVEEDNKEAQANDAAVTALSKIGDRRAIPALKHLLTSPDWEEDETSWNAAEALGSIVNQPFVQAGDPVAAARAWLKDAERA